MTVFFTPEAELDILEAFDWYEDQALGLGRRLHDEIRYQVQRIDIKPLQFPVVFAGVRRARLNRFPYDLLFHEVDDIFYVLACFHTRRDPDVWKRRV